MAEKHTLRKRHESSGAVFEAILDASAEEFAAHGFVGASTRSIAERAGVFQAQIGYHTGNKDELWRLTVDRLFDRLRSNLEKGLAGSLDVAVEDPVAMFADVIRRHVQHTARHPELHRIMAMEASTESVRTKYLLNNHVRPVVAALELAWADVQAAGHGQDKSAEDVYLMMISLAPLPFAQAPLIRPLLGKDFCTPAVHAEKVVRWILG